MWVVCVAVHWLAAGVWIARERRGRQGVLRSGLRDRCPQVLEKLQDQHPLPGQDHLLKRCLI